jgi:hypothetical protein
MFRKRAGYVSQALVVYRTIDLINAFPYSVNLKVYPPNTWYAE